MSYFFMFVSVCLSVCSEEYFDLDKHLGYMHVHVPRLKAQGSRLKAHGPPWFYLPTAETKETNAAPSLVQIQHYPWLAFFRLPFFSHKKWSPLNGTALSSFQSWHLHQASMWLTFTQRKVARSTQRSKGTELMRSKHFELWLRKGFR